MTYVQIATRLLFAVILSGIIGFEREIQGRAAGFRTHILVGIGSCLIMLTSIEVFNAYKLSGTVDPSRIAAQVVSGVGFLGAGTILRSRVSVRGLTTAASLWTVAGIGLALGCGFYKGAFIAAILAFFSLFFLTHIERLYLRKHWFRLLTVNCKGSADEIKQIKDVLNKHNADMRNIEVKKDDVNNEVTISVNLKLLTNKGDEKIIDGVLSIEGVKSAKWE